MTEQNANTWVHDRLVPWGDWSGSFQGGYDSQAVFVNDPRGRGFEELSGEIEITDKAVARVKLEGDKRRWKVIERIYLRKMSIVEVARDLHVSIGTADALLWAAKSAVGRYINDLERLDTDKKKPKMTPVRWGFVRPEEMKPAWRRFFCTQEFPSIARLERAFL